MRRIINPFLETKDKNYQCFGCSPRNKTGLKLQFWDAGEEIIAAWKPLKSYEGYMGVLHGGIQATLMDEIASWTVYTKCHTAGVTSRLNITYRKPVFIDKGVVIIKSRVKEFNKRIATIACELNDGENQVCAVGEVIYFCFPEKVAREKYMYPGLDAFFEKEQPTSP